jgi:general secretion pathway protein C
MTLSRYYTVINLVVLSLIIYGGVDIFYTIAGFNLVEVKTESKTNANLEKPHAPAKRPSFNQYLPAIKRDLFGTAEEASVDKDNIELQELEPTELKVSLLGTISGDDQTAVAIIEDKAKKKQDLYKEGDTIQDASIVKILRGKVVLRVQEKNQILTMEEQAAAAKGKPTTFSSGGQATPAVQAGTGTTISLDRTAIAKSLENVTELLSQVRIRPHYQDGKTDGLLISQLKPNTVFNQLGLRNGDIIHGLDGKTVQTTDDVMSFYEELKTGSSVSLDILRRGQKQTLRYEFK